MTWIIQMSPSSSANPNRHHQIVKFCCVPIDNSNFLQFVLSLIAKTSPRVYFIVIG